MVLMTKKKSSNIYGGAYATLNPQQIEEKQKEKNCTVIENLPKPEKSIPTKNPEMNLTINKKISDEKLKRFINFKFK